jgi:uncharacterized membrane protein
MLMADMARSNGSAATAANTNARPRAGKHAAPPGARRNHRPHQPGRNVLAMAALERAERAQQRPAQRLACRVAAACGTIRFVWIQVVLTAAWIVFNAWPGLPHIDPFPFVFLTLVLSVEAIFLGIFILIGQNEETRINERRAALDLQIDLLAEQESTQALRMLRQIGDKLGVRFEADPEIKNLEQATQPDALADEIDAITKREQA